MPCEAPAEVFRSISSERIAGATLCAPGHAGNTKYCPGGKFEIHCSSKAMAYALLCAESRGSFAARNITIEAFPGGGENPACWAPAEPGNAHSARAIRRAVFVAEAAGRPTPRVRRSMRPFVI